jgi:hypothetical protein
MNQTLLPWLKLLYVSASGFNLPCYIRAEYPVF